MLSSFAMWVGASSGETLGALASVLGGIIGALGSAAAVFIMLRAQRADEAEKVSAAILREVLELSKAPIAQLTICAKIRAAHDVVELADLLISQCQLARRILASAPILADCDATLASERAGMLKVLDGQLTAAKEAFPNAASFTEHRNLPTGIFLAT